MDYYGIIGPLIRLLPAETAHDAALLALKARFVPPQTAVMHPSLSLECFGLTFRNPVGLAAGFDKNAAVVDALFAQGFGFVEAGTVTPLPQPGNPRPRMFRMPADKAIINRLGFNNEGAHTFVTNLEKRKNRGVCGANIGKNKDSLDAIYDYTTGLEAVYDHADYITINISSPNTVGLRDLQQKDALSSLMKAITTTRNKIAKITGRRKSILYKIAPDLTAQDKEDIVQAAFEHAVDGLIISNTTITRPDKLEHALRNERGGLSGAPLKSLALETLRDIRRLSQARIPLIGVGGISSAEDAYARIKAGATLVQLYSALVYHGFGLVQDINKGLVQLLQRDGFQNIREAIGVESK